MEKKLTPEQRIEAYEYAIDQAQDNYMGMCWSLDEKLKHFTGIDTPTHSDTCEYYPEFKMFVYDSYPEDKAKMGYWFTLDKTGCDTRATLLLL